MDDRPLVSIVIPTYNHAAYLKDALQSVVSQTYANWEAVVVNNFSQDNTFEVVESFNNPRIRLVNFSNNGIIAASRNEGIRQAVGEWVAFLDSDDKWRPDKLEVCLARTSGDVGAVCHSLVITQSGEPWKMTKSGTVQQISYERLLFEGNCVATSAVMVRKTNLVQVGCFDEAADLVTAEDYDLWLRLARAGCRFVALPAVLGEYRWHAASASKAIARALAAEMAVVSKNASIQPATSYGDKLRLKRRIAIAYYAAARGCQHAGRAKEARAYYRLAIKSYPLLAKAYAGSLQAMF